MLKVRVIPCLDVKDGRVVKGVQFVSLRDAGDPVEQARAYDAAGGLASVADIERLRAREGRPIAGAVLGRALYVGAIRPAEALAAAA